jgi:O-antigen/teichoic acid export membrane protein
MLRPYAVQMFNHPATPQQHSLSALLASLAMALAAAVCLSAWPVLTGSAGDYAARIALAVAAALPAIALREFVRRHAFANLNMRRAFLVDLGGAALGLASLIVLGITGKMGATAAVVALAYSFALPSVICLLFSLSEYSYSFRALVETLRGGWSFGKWFLPHRLATEGQGYVVHWVSLAIAGPALTGLYSANLAIVSLANPLLIGLLNIMTPRAVRALNEGGPAGLKAQAFGEAVVLGTVLVLMVGVIAVFGDTLMAVLFPTMEHSGNMLLLLLALASSAGWLGAPAAVALQSSGRQRVAAFVSVGSFFCSLASVWMAMPAFGLTGAVAALLATETATSVVKWSVFLSLSQGEAKQGKHDERG